MCYKVFFSTITEGKIPKYNLPLMQHFFHPIQQLISIWEHFSSFLTSIFLNVCILGIILKLHHTSNSTGIVLQCVTQCKRGQKELPHFDNIYEIWKHLGMYYVEVFVFYVCINFSCALPKTIVSQKQGLPENG